MKSSFALIGLVCALLAAPVLRAQLTLTWNDNSTDELGFKIERSVGSDPFVEIGSVAANVTTYTDSSPSAPGIRRYRVYAFSAYGASELSNLLTINPPVIAAISPVTIDEDTAATGVAFNVTDSDTDINLVTVTATSSDTTLLPNGNIVFGGGTGTNRTITLTPAADRNGTATVTLVASDGVASTTATLNLTVTSVNDTPTISVISNQAVNEDVPTAALPFVIGDIETAPGSMTLTYASSNMTLVPLSAFASGGNGTNRTVVVTPAANQFGTATLTVTVSDGTATASSSFTLTVNSVNDAPTVSAISTVTVNEDPGAASVVNFTIDDVDNAVGGLNVTASSSNETLLPSASILVGGSGANRTVSLTPIPNQNGTATVTISVGDGAATGTRQFQFVVNAVNDAPTISALGAQTTSEDTPVSNLAFTVGDIETAAASLTVTASSSSTAVVPISGVTFGGSGANRTVSIAPVANASGTATITLTVSDGSLTATSSFNVTVTPVNDAPVISAIANQNTAEDTSILNIAFTISDPDNDPTTLVLSGSSSLTSLIPGDSTGISFAGSGANRTVTITPAANQTGTATVTVTVSDGTLSATSSFQVLVTPVNDVPTIGTVAAQSIAQGTSTGALAVAVGDVETTASDLVLTATSSNLTILPASGLILGGAGANRTVTATPTAGAIGTSTVTLFVSDGLATATSSFVLAVTGANTAPTIGSISNQVVSSGVTTGAVSFTVGDAELAAANLTVSANSSNLALLPLSGIVFGGSGANRTITLTPVIGQTGSAIITVTVSDGVLSTSGTVTLTVNSPVSAPPPPAPSVAAPFFLSQPVSQSVSAGASVTLSALVSGTPTPSVQWRKNGEAIAGANSQSLLINTTTLADAGTYTLFASNSGGTALSVGATLTVQGAPVFTSQPVGASVSVGATVVFSATVTGNPMPTLQWQRNGTAVAGATGGTLTLSNVGQGDAGTYLLVATNNLGSASSSGAVLAVSGAPVITAQPVGQTVLAGTSLTLSVVATGTPTPTYQWRRNGAAIAGATGASLGLPNLQSAGAGTYDVVVLNSAGSVTSAPAILVVDTPSYAGTYFGSFPDGGSWALYVRADNTGTYLAFLPGSSTAIVTNLIINPDGTFTVTGSTIAAAQAASPVSFSSSPSTAAAPLPFTFTGRILNGQLTASVLGRSVTGSADTGTTPSAGFYSASALLTASGTTFSVVGPSGKALVVTTSPTSVDGGVGTLSGTGAVTVATSSGAQLAMTVNADAKSIAATYTPVGSTAAVSFAGISDAVRVTSALANLSIRSAAGTLDQTLIVGFVVTGTSKPVLIRGIGPALAGFGVTGSLPDPKLDLARAGVAVASNDNWAAAVGDFFARVGAFGLSAGSRDAALMSTLEAANYTAQLSDVGGATGIAMVELYDTAADNGGRLINVSARSQVGTGGGILIAGFNVSGSGPRRMLIRAIGPGLTAFGVGGALADPKLDLYETGRAAVIASNDNWEASAAVTFGAVGAFGLTAGSRDAVLVVTLTPGSYTAQVSGVGSTTGVALVEVYEVP
jgi:hypothetical protein